MPPEKYREQYRISSVRLKNYDYGAPGAYFITIVTKNREIFFGEIQNGKMILSEIGKIVEKFWNEIPLHFPFVKLDAFVIMPNHVHGILWIDKQLQFKPDERDPFRRDAINRVSTTNHNELNNNRLRTINSIKTGGITGKHNPMLHQNISRIIRWYKGRCTYEINKNHRPANFSWQSRFYDHVIRNKQTLEKIRRYIQINPLIWHRDRNNPHRNKLG